MQKFDVLKISKRGKQHKISVRYNATEVGEHGTWSPKWTKESNQFLSADLDNCIQKVIPHILFAAEYISEELSLDGELNYGKWFNEHQYLDDKRFTGVEITKIQFYGKEALDSVKFWGHKTTQRTDKPFKSPLETPVIQLNKNSENYYPLVVILEQQMDDLQLALEEWLNKGKTLTKAQQASLFEQVDAGKEKVEA